MTLLQPVQQHQLGGLPFKRTICSCNICRTNCKTIPGYLLYDDLINMYFKVNDNNLRQVSIKNNVSYKTAQCAKQKLFKALDNERLAAESAIEKSLK